MRERTKEHSDNRCRWPAQDERRRLNISLLVHLRSLTRQCSLLLPFDRRIITDFVSRTIHKLKANFGGQQMSSISKVIHSILIEHSLKLRPSWPSRIGSNQSIQLAGEWQRERILVHFPTTGRYLSTTLPTAFFQRQRSDKVAFWQVTLCRKRCTLAVVSPFG